MSEPWVYTCGKDHGVFLVKDAPLLENGKYPRCPCGSSVVPHAIYTYCLENGLGLVEPISMNELKELYPASQSEPGFQVGTPMNDPQCRCNHANQGAGHLPPCPLAPGEGGKDGD